MSKKLAFLMVIFLSMYSKRMIAQENNYQPKIEGFEYIEVIKGKDQQKLPLLIAFHYSAGNPMETIGDYDGLKNPIRIIVPKGNHIKRSGFSYFPVDYYQRDSSAQNAIAKNTVDSIARFVKVIEAKFNQKAIVSGISQGGDIAFLLAVYYPELFKASFPFAAVIPTNVVWQLKNKSVEKIPIYLLQGEADKIVSIYTTRQRVVEIGNRLKIQLKSYPDLGHDISPQMKIDYSKIIDKMN